MQFLSRRHRVHPPPSVLDPAQPPPTRSHSVGVITKPGHIHTDDQITLGSDLLIIVDERLSKQGRVEQPHLPVLGELRQDLGLVAGVLLTPCLKPVLNPTTLHKNIRQRVRNLLTGEVRRIVGRDTVPVPQLLVSHFKDCYTISYTPSSHDTHSEESF